MPGIELVNIIPDNDHLLVDARCVFVYSTHNYHTKESERTINTNLPNPTDQQPLNYMLIVNHLQQLKEIGTA